MAAPQIITPAKNTDRPVSLKSKSSRTADARPAAMAPQILRPRTGICGKDKATRIDMKAYRRELRAAEQAAWEAADRTSRVSAAAQAADGPVRLSFPKSGAETLWFVALAAAGGFGVLMSMGSRESLIGDWSRFVDFFGRLLT
jgi:hypothetical protein